MYDGSLPATAMQQLTLLLVTPVSTVETIYMLSFILNYRTHIFVHIFQHFTLIYIYIFLKKQRQQHRHEVLNYKAKIYYMFHTLMHRDEDINTYVV